jgi:hypothetical protein
VKRSKLLDQLGDSAIALLWIAPIAIKRCLGAATKYERYSSLMSDSFDWQVGDCSCDADDLARGVTE